MAVGLGVVTALVLAFILEWTTGLRLSEEEQVAGIDGPVWGLESDLSLSSGNGVSGAGAPGRPDSPRRHRDRRRSTLTVRAGAAVSARHPPRAGVLEIEC